MATYNVNAGNGNDLRTKLQNAVSGDTVNIPAGVYTVPGKIDVAAGVSIIGAGSSATRILPSVGMYYWQQGVNVNSNPNTGGSITSILTARNNYNAIFMSYGRRGDSQAPANRVDITGTIVSGFSLEGNGRRVYGGLMVSGVENGSFSDIVVRDFLSTGLWIYDQDGTSWDTISVYNCSFGSSDTNPSNNEFIDGCVAIRTLDNVVINGLYIEDQDVSIHNHPGYLVQTGRGLALKVQEGVSDQAYPSDPYRYIQDTTIIGLVTNTSPTSSLGGQGPGICLKAESSYLEELTFQDSTFNTMISLLNTLESVSVSNGADGKRSVRFYDSEFTSEHVGGQTVELANSWVEFAGCLFRNTANVYFNNNAYSAGSAAGAAKNIPLELLSIHSCVFQGVLTSTFDNSIVRSNWGIKNLHFYNNTYLAEGTSGTIFDPGTLPLNIYLYHQLGHGGSNSNIHVNNNIFSGTTDKGAAENSLLRGSANVSGFGDGGDPDFVIGSSQENTFWVSFQGSAMVSSNLVGDGDKSGALSNSNEINPNLNGGFLEPNKWQLAVGSPMIDAGISYATLAPNGDRIRTDV